MTDNEKKKIYKEFLSELAQFQFVAIHGTLNEIGISRAKLKKFVWEEMLELSEDPEKKSELS